MLQHITGDWIGLTSPLIRVGLTVSPDDMRAALIEEIFSGAGLPGAGTDRITTGIADPLSALGVASANTGQVDYHELDVMNNVPAKIGTTEFWVFRPAVANNRLVVLLLGHNPEGISANTGAMAKDLIDAGYTVALGQPFPNKDAGGAGGFNTVDVHNTLPAPTAALNPLRYFLQGPIRIVNELQGEGFGVVFGCGQSGGGWEMALWGAIDARAKATCAHAGYWALYMTNPTRDWEQFLPLHSRGLSELDNIDYTDLAALACYPARTHIQSCNDTEGVFPRAQYDAAAPYENIVRNVAAKFGGRYDLQFDANSQHSYLPSRRAATVALFDSLSAQLVS